MTTNPPTPDDAARETAARAAFDAFYADGTPYTEIERAMFLQVADAVLAAKGISLAGPGLVSVSEVLIRELIRAAHIAEMKYGGWGPIIDDARAALSATRTAQDHDGAEE